MGPIEKEPCHPLNGCEVIPAMGLKKGRFQERSQRSCPLANTSDVQGSTKTLKSTFVPSRRSVFLEFSGQCFSKNLADGLQAFEFPGFRCLPQQLFTRVPARPGQTRMRQDLQPGLQLHPVDPIVHAKWTLQGRPGAFSARVRGPEGHWNAALQFGQRGFEFVQECSPFGGWSGLVPGVVQRRQSKPTASGRDVFLHHFQ